MGPDKKRRGGSEFREDHFDGRDLLVGRPEGEAVGKPATKAKRSPQSPPSPQPDAHGDAIVEILEAVRATDARINALEDTSAPAPDTAETLARETAALTQAVADARGALAKAAELAARRDGQRTRHERWPGPPPR